MRTKKEIETEITALKKLKPVGLWANKTAKMIIATIDEFGAPFDRTAGEWNELSDSERQVRDDARDWAEGNSDDRPSAQWKGFVK